MVGSRHRSPLGTDKQRTLETTMGQWETVVGTDRDQASILGFIGQWAPLSSGQHTPMGNTRQWAGAHSSGHQQTPDTNRLGRLGL